MNDAIGQQTRNNDYAKSSILAFLIFNEGRSKIQTLTCNENCLAGFFQGNLEVVNNIKQPSKCKVRSLTRKARKMNKKE